MLSQSVMRVCEASTIEPSAAGVWMHAQTQTESPGDDAVRIGAPARPERQREQRDQGAELERRSFRSLDPDRQEDAAKEVTRLKGKLWERIAGLRRDL